MPANAPGVDAHHPAREPKTTRRQVVAHTLTAAMGSQLQVRKAAETAGPTARARRLTLTRHRQAGPSDDLADDLSDDPSSTICRTLELILIKRDRHGCGEASSTALSVVVAPVRPPIASSLDEEPHGFRANPQDVGDAIKSAGVH